MLNHTSDVRQIKEAQAEKQLDSLFLSLMQASQNGSSVSRLGVWWREVQGSLHSRTVRSSSCRMLVWKALSVVTPTSESQICAMKEVL